MTDSHALVVQLDHLVRLLAERPAELDDQKLALHQLHAALSRGDVAIVATPTTLTATRTHASLILMANLIPIVQPFFRPGTSRRRRRRPERR